MRTFALALQVFLSASFLAAASERGILTTLPEAPDTSERCRCANDPECDGAHRYTRRFEAPPLASEARQALAGPQPTLDYIVDPSTPFGQRIAVARSASLPLVPWLGRILAAQRTLAAEARLHNWGLYSVNCSNAFFPEHVRLRTRQKEYLENLSAGARSRDVLGFPWVAPPGFTGFNPLTWDEVVSAPWPLQVQIALGRLVQTLEPDEGSPTALTSNGWYQTILRLPMDTPEEATQVVALTYRREDQTPAVYQRYREILRTPEFHRAAQSIAVGLRDHSWRDPHRHLIAQILIVDTLESDQTNEVKGHLSVLLESLRDWPGRWDHHAALAQPSTALLAAIRYGVNLPEERAHHATYYYLFHALEALDQPPFEWERPTPSSAARMQREFRDWFAGEGETSLEASATLERRDLEAMRQLLEESRIVPGGG